MIKGSTERRRIMWRYCLQLLILPNNSKISKNRISLGKFKCQSLKLKARELWQPTLKSRAYKSIAIIHEKVQLGMKRAFFLMKTLKIQGVHQNCIHFYSSRLRRGLEIPSWTYFHQPIRVDSKSIHLVIVCQKTTINQTSVMTLLLLPPIKRYCLWRFFLTNRVTLTL